MSGQIGWRWTPAATFALVLLSGALLSGAQQEGPIPHARIVSSDCTYLQNPDEFKLDAQQRYGLRTALTSRIADGVRSFAVTTNPVDANAISRKNFIDDSIFGRMAAAGIQPAPLTSDAEFLRRVMLDLTGRIPSPTDLTIFLNDPNPSKRDALVDSLVGTPEFIDKWTMFFGDLYKNSSAATNVTRYTQGRDAFYLYIKDAITQNRPYDQVAR